MFVSAVAITPIVAAVGSFFAIARHDGQSLRDGSPRLYRITPVACPMNERLSSALLNATWVSRKHQRASAFQ